MSDQVETLRAAETLISSVARVLAGTIGLAYVGGMIVVSVSLARAGFSWLGLFQPVYLIAGLWAVLLALVGALIVLWSILAYARIGEQQLIAAETERNQSPEQAPLSRVKSHQHAGWKKTLLSTSIVAWTLVVPWFAARPYLVVVWYLAMATLVVAAVAWRLGWQAVPIVLGSLLFAWMALYLVLGGLEYLDIVFRPGTVLFVGITATVGPLLIRTVRHSWHHATSTVAKDEYGKRMTKRFRAQTAAAAVLTAVLMPIYFAAFAMTGYGDIPLYLGGGQAAAVNLIPSSGLLTKLRDLRLVNRLDSLALGTVHVHMATPSEVMVSISTGARLVLRRADIEALVFP